MSRPRSLNYNGNFHVEDVGGGEFKLVFEFKGIKKTLPYGMSRQDLFYQKRKLQKDFEFFCNLMNIDV